MNVARALERAARHFPDKPAILFEDRRLSYRELDRAAGRTAHALAIRGVGPGDRVALFLPNIPAFAVAYQAVQKLGAIAVSANAMLTTEELAVLLEDSGAGVVFTVEALWPRLAPLAGDPVRRDRVVICEGEVDGLPTIETLGAGQPDELQARDMDPSAPAAILFTSGTTGRQKGATLSHANIVSNVSAVNRYMRTGPEDRPPAGHAAAVSRRGPERPHERGLRGRRHARAPSPLRRRALCRSDRGAPGHGRDGRPDHLHRAPQRRRAAGGAGQRPPVQVGGRHHGAARVRVRRRAAKERVGKAPQAHLASERGAVAPTSVGPGHPEIR